MAAVGVVHKNTYAAQTRQVSAVTTLSPYVKKQFGKIVSRYSGFPWYLQLETLTL